jgi:hypothetical protein
VAVALVICILNVSEHPGLGLFTIAFALVIAVLVIRGGRVVWSLVTAVEAIGLLTSPFASEPRWSIVIGIVSLACLLAPASLSFVWRRRRPLVGERSGAATWSQNGDAESDRPAGWYVDPESPKRMRYWSANEARWSGTTKMPRRIKREVI